ncbi:MAG: hypothetical protein R3C05_18380 [Pirellulaceae bacterium]
MNRLWKVPLDYAFLADGPSGIESISLPASLDILVCGRSTQFQYSDLRPQDRRTPRDIKRDPKLHGDKGSFLDVTDAVDAVRLPDGGYRIVTENVWCQNMSVYDFSINSLRAAMRK